MTKATAVDDPSEGSRSGTAAAPKDFHVSKGQFIVERIAKNKEEILPFNKEEF